MQQQMEQIQSDLAKRTVEATSGGGVVKAVAKCDGTIASIKIDPQAINAADAQLLEDMILSAVNQALAQAKEISNAGAHENEPGNARLGQTDVISHAERTTTRSARISGSGRLTWWKTWIARTTLEAIVMAPTATCATVKPTMTGMGCGASAVAKRLM